jgi:hypothetical protein
MKGIGHRSWLRGYDQAEENQPLSGYRTACAAIKEWDLSEAQKRRKTPPRASNISRAFPVLKLDHQMPGEVSIHEFARLWTAGAQYFSVVN